jgi:hypothetical protein
MTDGGQVAATILVLEASASLYAAFCPSWFTVRSEFFNDQKGREGNVKAIRQGELAATALTIPTGYATSILVGSWLPLVGAMLVSGLMVGGYEYSIRHPSVGTPTDPPGWMRAMDWGASKA